MLDTDGRDKGQTAGEAFNEIKTERQREQSGFDLLSSVELHLERD